MSTGYLFRVLDSTKQLVLDDHVTYASMYDRLKYYLAVLQIDEGETPHSLRGGCAITLALSTCSQSVLEHIGWASTGSLYHYSRLKRISRLSTVSSVMANVLGAGTNGDGPEKMFAQFGSSDKLPNVFPLRDFPAE